MQFENSLDRIAATVSSAAAYIFTSLALGAASLYPELCWPLFAYLSPSFWATPDCYSRNTNPQSLKSFSNALGSVS
jgi:hypothetical protein